MLKKFKSLIRKIFLKKSYAPYTVTFTGVDEKTDLDRLADIQKRYPYAEFGILVSKKRTGSGDPRYPDLAILEKLKKYEGLNLACHVCGGDLLGPCTDNGFETLDEFLNGNLSMFRRVQLNFGPRSLIETKRIRKNFGIGAHKGVEEVIIQQLQMYAEKELYSPETIFNPHQTKLSCLVDPSGGFGVEMDFVPEKHPARTGYTGGINPSNVARKFLQLKNSGVCRDFWIDMESGVRTDDWFDLDKIEKVLKQIDLLQ